jgi:translocator protein
MIAYHKPEDSKLRWLMLLFFLSVSFAASVIGSLFTETGPDSWYAALQKPDWNPPSWVFGPVWGTLYALIGLAGWLAWQRSGFGGAPAAFTFFFIQMALNAAWTVVFFGLEAPGAAFVEIVALWLFILLTLVSFWRIRPLAGGLLVPYLAWVTFASALNLAIWRMNA